MKLSVAVAVAALTVLQLASAASLDETSGKFLRKCSGKAKYKVTVKNFLKGDGIYKGIIPKDGLVFSPLTGAGHSGLISILVLRGYASPMVTQIAEKGDNSDLLKAVKPLVGGPLVKSAAAADGPTMSGKSTELIFEVDCDRPYISVVGMIAPSPDWIVAIPNFKTLRFGHFIRRKTGYLLAYDAGTDKGPKPPTSIFTPPDNTDLDVPQEPPFNIHPLKESTEDPGFKGRPVGKYYIERMSS